MAKTLLKISVFARLLIVHLRIGAAPCGLAPIRARPKIKPAKCRLNFWLWCVGETRVEVKCFLLLFIRIVAINVDIKSGAWEILFKKGI